MRLHESRFLSPATQNGVPCTCMQADLNIRTSFLTHHLPVKKLLVEAEEGVSPLELGQVLLGGVPAADDAEGGGERLDAVELARLPIVDGVGGDEVGQQARVRRLHPVERRVVQARPTGESITMCTYRNCIPSSRYCKRNGNRFRLQHFEIQAYENV